MEHFVLRLRRPMPGWRILRSRRATATWARRFLPARRPTSQG